MNVSAHAPVNLDIAACSDGVRQGGFIAYQPGAAGLFACPFTEACHWVMSMTKAEALLTCRARWKRT